MSETSGAAITYRLREAERRRIIDALIEGNCLVGQEVSLEIVDNFGGSSYGTFVAKIDRWIPPGETK